MGQSHISIPMPTHQFTALVQFLRDQGSKQDPVDVIHSAIDYWMENASWKKEELIENYEEGFWWKNVFIPEKSFARFKYKGKLYTARAINDGLYYEGKIYSPSEFVNEVSQTSRNAWRDVEFKFPQSEAWQLADDLRKQV